MTNITQRRRNELKCMGYCRKQIKYGEKPVPLPRPPQIPHEMA